MKNHRCLAVTLWFKLPVHLANMSWFSWGGRYLAGASGCCLFSPRDPSFGQLQPPPGGSTALTKYNLFPFTDQNSVKENLRVKRQPYWSIKLNIFLHTARLIPNYWAAYLSVECCSNFYLKLWSIIVSENSVLKSLSHLIFYQKPLQFCLLSGLFCVHYISITMCIIFYEQKLKSCLKFGSFR